MDDTNKEPNADSGKTLHSDSEIMSSRISIPDLSDEEWDQLMDPKKRWDLYKPIQESLRVFLVAPSPKEIKALYEEE